jgi:murein DD-endopeptidase MepM/ murein hydrolase activator NlpD
VGGAAHVPALITADAAMASPFRTAPPQVPRSFAGQRRIGRVAALVLVTLPVVLLLAGPNVVAQVEPTVPDPANTSTTTIPVVVTPVTVATTTFPEPTTIAPTVPVVVVSPEPPVTVATVLPGDLDLGFPPETATVVSVIPDETTSTIDPLATTSTVPETSSTLLDITGLDAADDDASSDEAPKIGIPVLPPAKIPPRNASLEKILSQLGVQQRKLVAIAEKRADEATKRLAEAQASLDVLKLRQNSVNAEIARIKMDLALTKSKLRARALSVFAGSQIEQIDSILNAEDANDFARNLDLVGAAQQDDTGLIRTYQEQVKAIATKNAEIDRIIADKQLEFDTIVSEQQALGDALIKVQEQLASITSGAAIALGGFVFPVQPPFNFVDTFGAPRMTGTKYEHRHEGTDIFAPQGTPLLAVQRGVVARLGVAVLGGNKLWVVGADGTQYYYAHLSAFAEGIQDGSFVDPGQILGFVGTTGNARGTPAHVHFEIHPGGGPAVNPYPFLDAVRRTDVTALLRASQAALATTVPPTIPGQIRAGIGLVREVALGAVDASAAGPTTTQIPGSAASKTTLPYRTVDPPATVPG